MLKDCRLVFITAVSLEYAVFGLVWNNIFYLTCLTLALSLMLTSY